MGIAYNPKIATDGLVLCLDAANVKSYPGTGTTWFDLSGRNNAVATAALSIAAEAGNAVRLDNTNNIQVTFSEPINKYLFTLSYWGRATAVPSGNYRRIWRLAEPNAPSNGSYFISDTREIATPYVLHYVKDFSTSNWDTRAMITQAEFLNFQWNNYVLVVTAENNWRSYRNGVLLGTNTTPTQDLTLYGDITKLDIGGVDTKFNISNITMHNRALTDQEIRQNFNALRGRFGV